MDAENRRREAQRQGRKAYRECKVRNAAWPIDFLEGYDRAQDEDRADQALAAEPAK